MSDLSQPNSICSKYRSESAVRGIALKLIVGETSGNTRSEGIDSGAVARNERVGDTKNAVRPAIQPDAAVTRHDAVIDIDLTASLRHDPAIRIAGIHAPSSSDPRIRSGKQAVCLILNRGFLNHRMQYSAGSGDVHPNIGIISYIGILDEDLITPGDIDTVLHTRDH